MEGHETGDDDVYIESSSVAPSSSDDEEVEGDREEKEEKLRRFSPFCFHSGPGGNQEHRHQVQGVLEEDPCTSELSWMPGMMGVGPHVLDGRESERHSSMGRAIESEGVWDMLGESQHAPNERQLGKPRRGPRRLVFTTVRPDCSSARGRPATPTAESMGGSERQPPWEHYDAPGLVVPAKWQTGGTEAVHPGKRTSTPQATVQSALDLLTTLPRDLLTQVAEKITKSLSNSANEGEELLRAEEAVESQNLAGGG